ncbi:hypothetical protein CDAR_502601, partial [Caerostris darwini]
IKANGQTGWNSVTGCIGMSTSGDSFINEEDIVNQPSSRT